MKSCQWDVLMNSRGGKNRVRILSALDTQPRNTHRLAEALNLDYKTVNHHLGVLMDEGLIRASGNDYGEIYVPTEQARHHWDEIVDIQKQLEIEQ